MVLVLIVSADALFSNNQFLLMLFLMTFILPWYKSMNAIHLSSVSKEKNPNFNLSQNKNHQSQFVGQTLDTCIHSPPRSPHMKPSPVHSCGVPPKVGHAKSTLPTSPKSIPSLNNQYFF